MLVAIETLFHDALRPFIPDEVEVATGPSLLPGADEARRVEVCAPSLKLDLPPGDDLKVLRQPAFFTQVHRWSATGSQVDFVLPQTARGQVVEVESPPGHPLRRGDDYLVEERTVRFFRPPAQADTAVVAFLRGDRAAGYQQRRRCEVSLFIRAWAREHGAADGLLSSAVAAALVASVDLGNLDDSLPDSSGVRLRLLRPAVTLLGFTRGAELVGEAPFYRAQADFLLRGELEESVTLGEPEPEGIIREVRRV